jgi:hypothetical protein
MRTMAITVLLLLSASCMQKGADGAYHFRSSKQEARNNDELKADAKKLGHDLQAKTREAEHKAGAALEHAGKKMQDNSEKRH